MPRLIVAGATLASSCSAMYESISFASSCVARVLPKRSRTRLRCDVMLGLSLPRTR